MIPAFPWPVCNAPRRWDRFRRLGRVIVLVLGLMTLASIRSAETVSAQDRGRLSVGAVAGSPGGLTARYDLGTEPGTTWPPQAVSAILSFDLDDYLLLNLHAVFDRAIPESPITVFAGPGLAVGVEDRRVLAGMAALVGLRFYRSRFEIFMQGHPRLMLVPGFRAFPGAGVGFRYHP